MQKICIVIPCYNEADRLPRADFEAFAKQHTRIDLLFVDDGSTDETRQILQQLVRDHENILALALPQNAGKGEAVRRGVRKALKRRAYDYIGYFDADLATPLSEIQRFIDFSGGELRHAVIAGARIKRMGSRIHRNEFRHYAGRIFATLASILLRLPFYDTQCGAKLIRADVAPQLVNKPFTGRWLFDLEIIARLIRLQGYAETERDILEVPLRQWTEKGDSRIRFSDLLRIPLDMIKIHRRYGLYKLPRDL